VKAKRGVTKELAVRPFRRTADWTAWLEKHHESSAGIWMRIAKSASGVPSVTYAEALEVALCYGWIDGQKDKHDAKAWLQKFTPRGPRSLWSRINREKAEALILGGRMKPAGLRAIERAKASGLWDAAYESSSRANVPEDLETELDRNPKAKAFFGTLDRANRYAILWRLQTAKKPETRASRLAQFVSMLANGQKLHP
jgi:uncharacterized protein YdeI (YjbR/CyaY-like superfamily)